MSRLASTAALLLVGLFTATESAVARELTFEERVNAQEAIDRVYYSHQIGTTKPFEQAVSRAPNLKESVALDSRRRPGLCHVG